jgi:DNA sulfur modification protein DndC
MTNAKQASLFEGQRLTMEDSIELTAQSLEAYGRDYRHWAIAFSGGKDSSTVVTIVAHLIASGRIARPESLTILYADTRLELTPLQLSAGLLMDHLRAKYYQAQTVLPEMDDRFFVYMLGRGVPPPSNTFRWCTPKLKVEPMMRALQSVRDYYGEKILMLTGVRVGESAARDQRIALSCGKNGAECGQGWFQEATSDAVADTLAPILHWRVCHVWDWLMLHAPSHGYPTAAVAEAYGGEDAEEINARTGCVGCNLASRDVALDTILKNPNWAYLAPLKKLRPLYAELKHAGNRLRKDGTERRKDGEMVSNPMRLGPLTFEARRYGLQAVLAIQDDINHYAYFHRRPVVELITAVEQARIEELIDAGTWPNGWSGDEVTGDIMLPEVLADGIVQPLLFGA